MTDTAMKCKNAKQHGLRLRDIMPQSLLGRSILILVLPVLILQVFTIYMFFDRHFSRITNRLAISVAGEVAMIADVMEHTSNPDQTLTQILNYTSQHLDLIITYKDEKKISDQKVQLTPLKALVVDTLDKALASRLHRPFSVILNDPQNRFEIDVQLTSGVLTVWVEQRRLYSSSSYIFLLWMIGTSVLLSVIAIYFMRRQIRPIRQLAIAADKFGRGQEALPLRLEGAREVRQATRAFIDMYDRIKRQVDQRTAMLAGVSHDLRTPLTRFKLGLDLLPEGPDVDALRDDVRGMEQMIGAYLDFIRGQGDEGTVDVNLSELLSEMADQLRRTQIDVTLDTDENIHIMARPIALRRAIANITGNAGRYGTKMRIEAHVHLHTVQIDIHDDGPGISPDQYADVFKPFVRLDTARTVRTGQEGTHVGLGLSISLDIIQSHGGTVQMMPSIPLGGLCVRLTLPR